MTVTQMHNLLGGLAGGTARTSLNLSIYIWLQRWSFSGEAVRVRKAKHQGKTVYVIDFDAERYMVRW